ncbi:MAG: D-glycero-beta-D-manno-heptose 1,7-bisphosphate 7-phosphatase [Candidatus Hydrogenedentes bacterium]|nr:D-glycero-beta-D-manno-heptose 1,7-bisphosphate 7-phosphatase [Candidatus Hydrogenedentota bacterium]
MTPLALTVFLDRDGVINLKKDYLHEIEEFEFFEGAPEAIRRLNDAGALVLVVTNQAGVARGYYAESAVHALHDHIQRELGRSGAHIDRFYYCPHHPEGVVPEYRKPCECRKPRPGMFLRAVADFGLAADRRFVIGDRYLDLIAGAAAGCATVLVRTGYGQETAEDDSGASVEPDYVASSLADAVDWVLAAAGG